MTTKNTNMDVFTEVVLRKNLRGWRFHVLEIPVSNHRKSSKHRHLTLVDGSIEKMKESFIDAFSSKEPSGISTHEVYGVCEAMSVADMKRLMLSHMEGRLAHEKVDWTARFAALESVRVFPRFASGQRFPEGATIQLMAHIYFYAGTYTLTVREEWKEMADLIAKNPAYTVFDLETPMADIQGQMVASVRECLMKRETEWEEAAKEMARLRRELDETAEHQA